MHWCTWFFSSYRSGSWKGQTTDQSKAVAEGNARRGLLASDMTDIVASPWRHFRQASDGAVTWPVLDDKRRRGQTVVASEVEMEVASVRRQSVEQFVVVLVVEVAACGEHVRCWKLLRKLTDFKSVLTLSPPIPLRLYTLPYWSNPVFLIFDIRALWRSGLSAPLSVPPERPNVKN